MKKIGIIDKYIFKELIKTFLFFVFAFCLIYTLIDYSSSVTDFQKNNYSSLDIGKFYIYTLIQRMDLIIPFGLLISSIRLLSRLNSQNEFIALFAGGISLPRLMRPFLLFSLLPTLFMYFAFEKIQPHASEALQTLEFKHLSTEDKAQASHIIQEFELEDSSLIVFQNYNPISNQFFDVFWVKNLDNVYHLKTLSPSSKVSFASQVHQFHRNKEGQLKHVRFYENKSLPEMQFNMAQLKYALTEPRNLPLSKLGHLMSNFDSHFTQHEGKILVAFWNKLLLPLLCIITVLAPAPFCLRFSRSFSPFFVFLISTFSLLAFYLIVDAFLILGENRTLHPALAVIAPCFIFYSALIFNYVRFLKHSAR